MPASAHLRTRSALSSPSSSSRPTFFSARKLKAALQFLVAVSVTLSLLVYLAGSSPSGFSPSATAPAALAAADAFLRLKPRPAPPATPLQLNDTTLEQVVVAIDPPAFDFIQLDPFLRPERVSNARPWVLAKPADQLPPCDKILLFTFMPWWGFASEYILYARAAAAAKRLGYTLVEDDSNWNYGRLSNYFLQRKLSCVPPSDWADHRKAYPLHQGSNWRGRPRLRYSRTILSNIDDWTRDEYLSSAESKTQLAKLQRTDKKHAERADRWILEEGGSLPNVFEEVFGDQAGVVKELWRPKRSMQDQVDLLVRQAGLSRERWHAGASGDNRDKRGPVIALHVRLGDKASEYEHDSAEMGIINTFGNLTVYIEAAHDAYRRLIPSRYPSLAASAPSTDLRFTPYARPSLLLVTAEPGISSQLATIPLAGPFRVIQTPEPDVRLKEVADVTQDRLHELQKAEKEADERGDGPKAYVAAAGAVQLVGGGKMVKQVKGPAGADDVAGRAKRVKRANAAPPADLGGGYVQSAFNALPLLERVVHTQAFVRDLTVMAREADAAVVSGSSNIGRLAMLIAGKDAVIGLRDPDGRSLGGRVRSVDAHFYPTAYSSAVYAAVEDVEDLEHAAFVPEEQHAAEQAALEEKRKKKKGRGKGQVGSGARADKKHVTRAEEQ
ncbi:hypothetical protein JCM10207_006244 [Rhodosporidiobolus poonsookiae]